jgi:hypothetical protein
MASHRSSIALPLRDRVSGWETHADPLRPADEMTECIRRCENPGDTVLDAAVVIRPNERVAQRMES